MNNTNVTPIESKQPGPMARFTITASLDGFPVQIEVEGKADNLRAMIDRLKTIGAEPPQTATLASAPSGAIPVCPIHKSPMGVALLERRRFPEKSRILSNFPISERDLRVRYRLLTVSHYKEDLLYDSLRCCSRPGSG